MKIDAGKNHAEDKGRTLWKVQLYNNLSHPI